MAVITRYIVVRNGVELDKVFDIKKEADAYDKMLDAAENLSNFIKKGDIQINLEEEMVDAVSIYLAKNAPEVVKILKGIKPNVKDVSTSETGQTEKTLNPVQAKEKKMPGKKTKNKIKNK